MIILRSRVSIPKLFCFNGRAYEDPLSNLMNLSQMGNLQDYLDQFDVMLNRVDIDHRIVQSSWYRLVVDIDRKSLFLRWFSLVEIWSSSLLVATQKIDELP